MIYVCKEEDKSTRVIVCVHVCVWGVRERERERERESGRESARAREREREVGSQAGGFGAGFDKCCLAALPFGFVSAIRFRVLRER